tara:strand:+ start:13 stop:483 length:471 start_codon:yes stop_codon:yes gene_type:complete
MPTTTFAGPVKAGGISTSTGNILGENVANQGFAKMVQVAAVTESGSVGSNTWTDIVIPAHSQIVRIAALTTAAFGSSGYIDVLVNTEEFIAIVSGEAVGLVDFVTHASVTANLGIWKDTGASDLHVYYKINAGSAAPEDGVATLIVEYIQNNNLTA